MTPAIRALEKADVPFVLHPYEHDESAEAYGLEAVEALGVEAARVFKTLVCTAAAIGGVISPASLTDAAQTLVLSPDLLRLPSVILSRTIFLILSAP